MNVTYNARFCINLLHHMSKDHLLQVDFRLDRKETGINANHPFNRWGKEERFPLKSLYGHRIKVEITINFTEFLVSVSQHAYKPYVVSLLG